MKYFVFRNQTVEPFFSGGDVAFSGYDDISLVPDEASRYIWFYQVPVGSDSTSLAQEAGTYANKLRMVLQRIPQDKPLIVFTLETIFHIPLTGNNFALRKAVDGFNADILEMAEYDTRLRVVDFQEFVGHYPVEQLINWKFYFISQAVLNPKLAKDFKAWWTRKQDELMLKRKKCLVLDLDNTLWGGILGEDGPAGIQIGGDYPGKAFAYWQHALLELKKTGVMLAVCSKNNEADVMEVWERNPFMVLRKDDFVAWRINWQDKATNIQELASELNIGLDSMVFVDDNPSERALIEQLLPMVSVPEFPQQPYQLMDFFHSLVNHYFRVYRVTNEDLKKTEQYKANARRVAEQAKFTNLDDYLCSLEIKIDILPLDRFNVSRAAQMTQKTNQFNLTTQRYTENDLLQMIADGSQVFCINVSDRFGDNGITGEIILCPTGMDTMSIDTFLLSCRILGKGIEYAFLDTILNLIADKGCKTVEATFLETPKNEQVADFYEQAGFSVVEDSGETKKYFLELNKRRIIKDYYTINIKQ